MGGAFVNAQHAKVMRITLEELGHHSPPLPFTLIIPSSVNAHAPWKCDISGSWTTNNRKSSRFCMSQELKTLAIILLRPMMRHIIVMCDRITYTWTIPHDTFLGRLCPVLGEGV